MQQNKLITGVTCLTIPCETASESERNAPRPIYLGHGYICPYCGGFYYRYKPCSHHMGMVMNIPCNCKMANEYHRRGEIRCTFCMPGGPKFSSFAGLRSHVQLKHSDVGRDELLHFAAKRLITEEEEMGKSIADVKSERGIGGPPMLKGSDIPKSVNKVRIKVKELREAPANFKSPFIIDLADPVHEREAFAVNITNLRALASLVGMDPDTADVEVLANKVKGKSFDLFVSMTNNPQSKKMVRSLFFASDGA